MLTHTLLKHTLICADCGVKKQFSGPTVRSICDHARSLNWAINRDNTVQWCPSCAPNHRHVGKRGNKDKKV